MGISDTEHLICVFLLGHSEASQEDAADALRLDKTTTSKALLSLEKKGFVERHDSTIDLRKKCLCLTAAGGNLYDDLEKKSDERVQSQLAQVPIADRPRLQQAIREVSRIFGEVKTAGKD